MKTLYARPLLAAILAVTLWRTHFPGLRQDTPQTPQAAPAKTANANRAGSLGSAKYNSTVRQALSQPVCSLQSDQIGAPVLTNSPRIDQLIHDGKLELSMQEAVELALENSMDIVVQRY